MTTYWNQYSINTLHMLSFRRPSLNFLSFRSMPSRFRGISEFRICRLTHIFKFQSTFNFCQLVRLPRKVIACVTHGNQKPLKFGWNRVKSVWKVAFQNLHSHMFLCPPPPPKKKKKKNQSVTKLLVIGRSPKSNTQQFSAITALSIKFGWNL